MPDSDMEWCRRIFEQWVSNRSTRWVVEARAGRSWAEVISFRAFNSAEQLCPALTEAVDAHDAPSRNTYRISFYEGNTPKGRRTTIQWNANTDDDVFLH